MSWINHLHNNNPISLIRSPEKHQLCAGSNGETSPNGGGTTEAHLEREEDDEERVRGQIRQERDGDPRPQHGLEPVPVPIPARPGLAVEERGRPPLQRGGAGRRGGGRDVEAVHRRHAPRIGRTPPGTRQPGPRRTCTCPSAQRLRAPLPIPREGVRYALLGARASCALFAWGRKGGEGEEGRKEGRQAGGDAATRERWRGGGRDGRRGASRTRRAAEGGDKIIAAARGVFLC